jgi:hypothetical protein
LGEFGGFLGHTNIIFKVSNGLKNDHSAETGVKIMKRGGFGGAGVSVLEDCRCF